MKNRIGRYIRAVGLMLALLVALGHSSPALATELNYNFQQINVPGSARTTAFGINDHGDIVGMYNSAGSLPSGFLLHKGAFMTITVPGSILTTAHGINNRGNIVGDFVDTTFHEHVFLLRKDKFTIIDFPGAAATDRPGINDRGDIAGNWFTAENPDVAHGFLLTHDGTFKTIAYPGAVETGAGGINAQGEIVGVWDNDIFFNFHGFVRSRGSFVSLDYPGAIGALGGTNATGINSRSQVVGIFFGSDGGHGFVWNDGVFSPPIDAPAGVPGTTLAYGINNIGQIVGQYRDPTLGHRVGFVATPVCQSSPKGSHQSAVKGDECQGLAVNESPSEK